MRQREREREKEHLVGMIDIGDKKANELVKVFPPYYSFIMMI